MYAKFHRPTTNTMLSKKLDNKPFCYCCTSINNTASEVVEMLKGQYLKKKHIFITEKNADTGNTKREGQAKPSNYKLQ